MQVVPLTVLVFETVWVKVSFSMRLEDSERPQISTGTAGKTIIEPDKG